jgi:hypothetical protein
VLSDREASDIVQDIFCRIQQKAHLYKPSGRVLSWMRKLSHNIIKDIVRQHFCRRQRDTNYALARPPEGGEVEGQEATGWEYGDDPNEIARDRGRGGVEELHGIAVPCDFVIMRRSDGGDNLVWIGSFPRRAAKWGKADRGRRWMRGGGTDDVRGMFRSYGLVPEEGLKSR